MKKHFKAILLLVFILVCMTPTVSFCTATKGLVGKEDLRLYDGVSTTFTRKTSSGGTATYTKIENGYVDVLQVYGDGSERTDVTLNKAKSQIGSTKNATLYLSPGTWTLSNNVDLSGTNISIEVSKGAIITGAGRLILPDAQKYYVSWRSNFGATLDDIGTGVTTTLIVDESVTLTTSETIPLNITLKVEIGAVIDITNSGDLTFKNDPEAGLYQIFSYSSTGRVAGLKKSYPEWWGENTTPGTTDMTDEIRYAIDSISTGVVQFQQESYAHTGIEIHKSGITLKGDNAYGAMLTCTSGNNIELSDSSFIFYVRLEGLTLKNDSDAGHLLYIKYGISNSKFDFNAFQYDTDKSIIYGNFGGVGGLIDCDFTGDVWEVTVNQTVPAVSLTGSGTNINENKFHTFRAHSRLSNIEFFNLTNTSSSTYNYNNNFDQINFEQSNGGAIVLAGQWGGSIKNCSVWDCTTTTGDLLDLTNDGATGKDCYYQVVNNFIRIGGALGSGVYDIALNNGHYTIMTNVAGPSGSQINVNSKESIVINSISATIVNDTVLFTEITHVSNSTYNLTASNKITGPLSKLNLIDGGELTIASGEITITNSQHTVDTEGDVASDDLSTINGGSAGDVIFLRPINDARTVVVKHAAGNIYMVGKVDFTMDSARDTVILFYQGNLNSWAGVVAADVGS